MAERKSKVPVPKSSAGPLTRLGVRNAVDEATTNVATMTEALGRASMRAAVYERCLHLFNTLDTAAATMDRLLDVAGDAIPCEASSVLLADAERVELTVVAARGPVAERVKGLKLEMGQGLAGVCAMFKQTLPVSDVSKDQRFQKEIAAKLGFPTTSILVAPIIHGGEGVGVVQLINRRAGHEWPAHEVELVEKLGRVAGTLLTLIQAKS